MTIIRSIDKLPEDRCYGLITSNAIYIPGDERSRTAPGHGYPAHTESLIELEVFMTENELKKKIETLVFPSFGSPKKFRAFIINPIDVAVGVNLEMSTHE